MAMLRSFSDRAPAIAWVGQFFVPLGHAFPFLQTGLLCFTLLTEIASIFLLYKILCRSFGRTFPALTTCCILASGALFTGLAHTYLVEPLQALSTVWVLGLAAYQDRLSRPVLLLHTASAVAFGLLVKTSTPLFQLPALLYLAYALLRMKSAREPEKKMWNSRAMLYASIFGTALIVSSTAAWYVVNYQAALAHVIDASSGSAAIFYGHKASLPVKLAWWIREFQKSFFWLPLLLLILLTVPRAVYVRWKRHSGLTTADILTLVSVAAILLVLVSFSLNINEDTRYLFALLPYLAVVVCWVAVNTSFPPIVLLWGAFAIMQLVFVSLQLFGVVRPSARLSDYLQPYRRDDLALRDNMFGSAATLDSSPGSLAFVGEGVVDFNANSLAFYNAIQGGQGGVYYGLGWANTDSRQEWRSLRSSGSKYYVYRRYPATGDSDLFNKFAKPLFVEVVNDPGFSFRPDKSNERVLVFENVPGGARYTGGLGASSADYFPGANPSGTLPYGLLEFPKQGFSLQGKSILEVVGWAVSPSGIGRIQLLIDDKQVADASRNRRPDVAKTYPNDESTGYGANVDISSLPNGLHEISVVVDSRNGLSRRIANVQISISLDFAGVNPEKRLPFGLLEFPRAGSAADGKTLPIVGWAVFPSGIGSVEILMDGHRIKDAERQSRPDVKKAYPAYAFSSGFKADVDLTAVPTGAHRISAVSHSSDGLSRVIGQASVFRP